MTARTLVVIVEPRSEALRIAATIDARTGLGGEDISAIVPDEALLGDGFWSGEAAQHWWEEMRLDERGAVMVARDRSGLASVLHGVASSWIVWCATADAAAAYAPATSATAIVANDPDELAQGCADHLARSGWRFGHRPSWGPFRPAVRRAEPPAADPRAPVVDVVPPSRISAEPADHAEQAWPQPATAPTPAWSSAEPVPPLPALQWHPAPATGLDNPADLVVLRDVPTDGDIAPIYGLEDGTATAVSPHSLSAASPPVNGHGRARGIGRRLGSLLGRSDPTPVDVGALGQALTAAHDTVVLVGSRKGGVGKTTESLALGFLAAQAVEVMGGSAVVLDANLTNADISVKLHLPLSAPTVRDLVTALMSNAVTPTPVAVRSSSLRVYGEHRETERYEAPEIAQLAGHLRRYYTVTVVDLPNAVPGIEDRAEAVVDAWLPHADVVVIPVDTSIASFEGAGDMLTAIRALKERRGGRYNPGVVVAFLRPADIDPRRFAPDLAGTLEQLQKLGAAVVDIPDSSRMAMVDWTDHPVPLTDVDPKVTKGYWDLLDAVVAVRPELGQ
jgi:MinD-like ATPase involved in chromosome partitioning or flagellar assembly